MWLSTAGGVTPCDSPTRNASELQGRHPCRVELKNPKYVPPPPDRPTDISTSLPDIDIGSSSDNGLANFIPYHAGVRERQTVPPMRPSARHPKSCAIVGPSVEASTRF